MKHILRQRVCPVSGDVLTSRGPVVKVLVGDYPLYLCCRGLHCGGAGLARPVPAAAAANAAARTLRGYSHSEPRRWSRPRRLHIAHRALHTVFRPERAPVRPAQGSGLGDGLADEWPSGPTDQLFEADPAICSACWAGNRGKRLRRPQGVALGWASCGAFGPRNRLEPAELAESRAKCGMHPLGSQRGRLLFTYRGGLGYTNGMADATHPDTAGIASRPIASWSGCWRRRDSCCSPSGFAGSPSTSTRAGRC